MGAMFSARGYTHALIMSCTHINTALCSLLADMIGGALLHVDRLEQYKSCRDENEAQLAEDHELRLYHELPMRV